MEFREYLEKIGIRKLTEKQRINESQKMILDLDYKTRKDMENHIGLFEKKSTNNWMNHLNSPFAKNYDIAFSNGKSLKEYEEVASEIKNGTDKRYIVDVGAGTGIITN
jgi:hypothetical protein